MSEEHVTEGLASAGDLAPEPPDDRALADLPNNDIGNAQRLIARHGDDLRFVNERYNDKSPLLGWLVWNGAIWQDESSWALVKRRAHETVSEMRAEAQALEKDPPPPLEGEAPKAYEDRLGKLVAAQWKYAVSSGNRGKLDAMATQASPYLLVSVDALDADRALFAVQEETLLLRTGRGGRSGDLSAPIVSRALPSRADMITRASPVAFDPEADCPGFRAFLARVVPDPDVRIFLQTWFGYCLTGHVSEQRLVLLYGRGANGKSTLLNVLRHIFGSYAVTLPFESLVHDDKKKGSDATPDWIRVPGARLVLASEPAGGARLAEQTVKVHTGGEPIPARALYGAQFEFHPTHKMVLAFNQRPRITSQDDGIWRRVLMVPFNIQIPEAERDQDFTAKLIEGEAAGILNWCLDGWRLWAERGLVVPDAVRDATSEYRADSDPLGDFLDSCTRAAKDKSVLSGRLWEAYQDWSKKNGQDPISNKRFGTILTERYQKRKSAGLMKYEGLELLPSGDDQEGAWGGSPPDHGGFSGGGGSDWLDEDGDQLI